MLSQHTHQTMILRPYNGDTQYLLTLLLKLTISYLSDENEALKVKCNSLEERVNSLEKKRDRYAVLIKKKQERFSRRNNVPIVPLPTMDKEDCIDIFTKVFKEVGFPSLKIERAHRDGKIVHGRDRHLLVINSLFTKIKFLFCQLQGKLWLFYN